MTTERDAPHPGDEPARSDPAAADAVVAVEAPAETVVDSDDPAVLKAVIARLRAGIAERDRHILELEAIAHADELTGLLNRRGFLHELERAIQFARRYAVEASLLYIDLDGFKSINDQFGHSAGDTALAAIAKRFAAALRASDIVGRIGGDEFAALLWRSTDGAARQTADRLVEAIASEPLPTKRGPIRLGASIGIVRIGPDDTAATALARADRAMYDEKNSRRGRSEG